MDFELFSTWTLGQLERVKLDLLFTSQYKMKLPDRFSI